MSWNTVNEKGAAQQWLRFREISPGHSHVVQENADGSGTSFDVDATPISADGYSSLEANLDSSFKQQVQGTPSAGEFRVDDVTITMGDTVGGSSVVSTDYMSSVANGPHYHVIQEHLTVDGLTGTLTYTPVEGSERLFNTISSLRRATSSLSGTRYSISGKVLTFGAGPGDNVWAAYLTTEVPMRYHEHVNWEFLSGTGTEFQLAFAPVPDSVRLKYFTGGTCIHILGNQFTCTTEGAISLLAAEVAGGETLIAFYLKRLS